MKSLILVDIQNDFVPGGALAVREGDRVVPVANKLVDRFDLVVATQDWHPPDHGSFAANHSARSVGQIIELNGLPQVLWPVHCVQNTPGAAFVPTLRVEKITQVFRKGIDANVDSYSGFFDNGRLRATGLGDFLKTRGVRDVFVMGLATDYCVKYTALDARSLGFDVTLIEDGCRGVDLHPGDVAKAIEEMRQAGITITRASAFTTDRLL